ncbi:MAG: ABC transporter permease [Eubacterium sp.]|nr:ABC transporter permease [Eubacterium sp.]
MNNRKIWAGPYIIWAAGFIILPLFMVLYYGLTGDDGRFTFANLTAFGDPIHYRAFIHSILIALASTLVCLIISYPLALILSRRQGRNTDILIMIFVIPMWINFLLRILALQMILSNTGILNALLGFFRLPPVHLMYSRTAIIIGMVYDYLPFMILPIYNAMSRIDKDVIEAARDLGADNLTTLTKILIPLSMPGVISGIIMVFIPSISEFVVADVLGGSKILLYGNVIDQEFNLSSNWNLGSGLSIILMLFIFVSMAIMNRAGSGEEDMMLW